MEAARNNFEVRELRLQLKAKWLNQWDRTLLEVLAVLLDK